MLVFAVVELTRIGLQPLRLFCLLPYLEIFDLSIETLAFHIPQPCQVDVKELYSLDGCFKVLEGDKSLRDIDKLGVDIFLNGDILLLLDFLLHPHYLLLVDNVSKGL